MLQLVNTYCKHRKRFKIDRRATWPKEYMIQMPRSKNKWMVIFQKSPLVNKYSDAENVVWTAVTWYYGPQGLRAFRPSQNYIEVFNAHLFNRYNERLGLNLFHHADIIKRFFLNSGRLLPDEITHNGKQYTMSLCKEGATLGNYHQAKPCPWLVNNTFITHDQMHKKQVEGKMEYFSNTLGKLSALLNECDIKKVSEMQHYIGCLLTHLDIVA